MSLELTNYMTTGQPAETLLLLSAITAALPSGFKLLRPSLHCFIEEVQVHEAAGQPSCMQSLENRSPLWRFVTAQASLGHGSVHVPPFPQMSDGVFPGPSWHQCQRRHKKRSFDHSLSEYTGSISSPRRLSPGKDGRRMWRCWEWTGPRLFWHKFFVENIFDLLQGIAGQSQS